MRRSAATAVLVLLGLLGLIALSGPAAAATRAQQNAAQETQVTKLVNAERAKAGCGALRVDARLVKAARGHSQDMVDRKYFAHNTPGGVTPWTRIANAGYPKAALGENIAAGQATAAAVVRSWMGSTVHRRNILNCSFRAVGVGLATGGQHGYYWTQDLGSK